MLKDELKEIVKSQRESILTRDRGIRREKQINLSAGFCAVISGIRRCGKSTLLLQLMPQHFYYLNLEDARLASFELQDFLKLEEVFQELYGKGIFFFDEIQNIPQWERYIRNLVDNKVKCVVTGSNASLLSKELGTKLTGRHLTTELFPFSYSEFLTFSRLSHSEESFKEYLSKGGFPEYLKVKNSEVLQHLLNDIISRDIIARLGIKDFKTLKELTIFLISNIGKEFSYNKITRYFKLGSVNTLISYISYLEDSYLFFTVPRINHSFKKQVISPKKIYCIDTGFARVNSVSLSNDDGRILENSIFLHLRRKYREIYYFKEEYECDFVIKETLAVQACYHLTKENEEREIKGLNEAMKKLNIKKGLIVTLNQEERIGEVEVIPAWKFFTNKA